jgi:hypothetical protein
MASAGDATLQELAPVGSFHVHAVGVARQNKMLTGEDSKSVTIPLNRKRIAPLQLGESCEVAVGGVEFEPVLDRQCSEVSVRNQITVHSRCREKSRQDLAMPLRRRGNPRGPAPQPSIYLIPGSRHIQRALEDPRVGGQS